MAAAATGCGSSVAHPASGAGSHRETCPSATTPRRPRAATRHRGRRAAGGSDPQSTRPRHRPAQRRWPRRWWAASSCPSRPRLRRLRSAGTAAAAGR
eukprot:7326074-Prymnesium_polylepis.2